MSPRPAAHAAPTTCSAFSSRLGEPIAGTAPTATAWLALEQPGPWGARALTESRLDPELGAELGRRAEGTGVRIALVRRVGHHGPADADAPRRVLMASTIPGRTGLRAMTVHDPCELLDLDFTALGSGQLDAGDPHPEPALLICTNSKRDQCCAVFGRALARDVADLREVPGELELWETDHLGGHRFAPTALVLPTGYLYGRVDAATALLAVERAAKGAISLDNCRGRSTWSRRGQAADLALRAELALHDADAVEIVDEQEAAPDRWTVFARAQGETYRVEVHQQIPAEARPESCGKAFGNPPAQHVVSITRPAEM